MDSIIGLVVIVFAVGFFVRTAYFFKAAKKQKDEIIAMLKEIRDALGKGQ